ncbi:MAG: ATP-binding protein [Bacteroidota bacterium]
MAAVLICAAQAAAQKASVIQSLLDRGRYCLNNGKPDSGVIYADEALTLSLKAGDTQRLAKAMTMKGKGLFALGKNKEAVDLYFNALRLCKSPADDKQIAFIYGEIGYAYYAKGHPQEAREYYEKEVNIRRVVNGRDSIGNQLINLAIMYQSLQQYDSAESKLKAVADILTRNNDRQLRGYYCNNWGALKQVTGQRDTAKRYYTLACDIWGGLGNHAQLFKATFNLGYIAFEEKKYAEAIRYYHQSEAAAKKYGSGKDIAHLYGTMAEAYAAAGDHKSAYESLYKYASLSDSFNREDFNSYVVKLDKQFQTDKNRETIQQQQMQLTAASLEVQQQKSRALLFVLILVAVVFAGILLFGYLTFRGRVRKQVDEAKNKFFANVVHEIRTPLSMIQGPVKVLQDKVTDESMRFQLDIAERNVKRLNDLVNQMLDISKIDAAKFTLTESLGNLDHFFNELNAQFAVLCREKNIVFIHQSENVAGVALFDNDALEKIVSNLAGNAIKYTPAGGSVGIEAGTSSAGDGLVLTVRVWDTGPGIPKEEQAQIFERFYRRKEHEASGTKGMGIGLALVKDLVALMNGTIEIESEPGKGTVFTVKMQLKAAAAPSNAIAGDEGASIILLVEDDADIMRFNRALLAERGYNILCATNGVAASEILSTQLPDLVITDLMMPEKDGMTLLKEIRGNVATAHIPVIILSAKASAPAKIEGVSEGAQVYLPKPFQPEELAGLVKNQLQVLEKQREYYRERSQAQGQPVAERFAGNDPFTQKCYDTIQEHLDDAQLSVERLAELMNINRSHFQRKIKTLTGYSPSELIKTIRLEKARELLLKKEGNITETAYSTGFTSQSYFTKCYTEHFGYPPSQEGTRAVPLTAQ